MGDVAATAIVDGDDVILVDTTGRSGAASAAGYSVKLKDGLWMDASSAFTLLMFAAVTEVTSSS